VRGYKSSGGFIDAETAEDIDHGDLRFLGQAGMTTGKHHPQQVVIDLVRGKELFARGRERPIALD
jgi:hypothetical protein